MTFYKTTFVLLAALLITQSASAQLTGSKQPVEIEASQQLEWLRDQNKYRATGDVVITQGDTKIRGNTAEAEYDAATGPSALTIFTVTGNVIMTNLDRTITADSAVYDTRSQILTLSGTLVTLKTPQMSVNAKGGMEYNAAENKAIARNAETKNEGKTLKADQVTAWISKETNALDHATANGHVIITNQGKDGQDVAQSNIAVYDAVKNTIKLNGNVKLTRGANHMQGDQAIVDLASGKSSLINDAKTGGRVRAIFTPGDSATPLPNVTTSVPMINSKKEFEKPYAVGR